MSLGLSLAVGCEPIHSLRQFETLKRAIGSLAYRCQKEQGSLPIMYYSSLLFRQYFVKQLKSAPTKPEIQLQREISHQLACKQH